MRTISRPLYGVTIDDVSNLPEILTAQQHLSQKPITRIVFDLRANVSDYRQAITQLHPGSYLMAELVDSSDMKSISNAAFHNRVAQYLAAYGDLIDVWEIGNEVNGSWLGNYASVQTKIIDAYQQIKAAGKRTALTLYYNIGCDDGPGELSPLAFTERFIPADMRNGLDYVFLSYYEGNCNHIRPTEGTWAWFFGELHKHYPNALLGFGEIGLPDAARNSTLIQAMDLLKYYYGLKINLPYYVGGYFWWYYAEDMVPYNKPLWAHLNAAMQGY